MKNPEKSAVRFRKSAKKPKLEAPTLPIPEPPPQTEAPAESQKTFRLKVFGVGGAGCNAADTILRVAAEELDGVEFFALNTDAQALDACQCAEKIQIGATVTRGLSAGGDTGAGEKAALESGDAIGKAIRGADIVFLLTGLGGGTGTGAAPVVARLAKEHGSLVLVFAILPFSFEGERRKQQASTGLDALKAQADAVICFPNDKLFQFAGENTPVQEAFQHCNELMAEGVRAIWRLLTRRGLVNLDFADLRNVIEAKHCEGVIGTGAGEGKERIADAVKSLLASPFLSNGEALGAADGVLVSISGGKDLTLAAVQRVMEPITKAANPRAKIALGAAIDPSANGKLSITLIASQRFSKEKPRAAVVGGKIVPASPQRIAVPSTPAPAASTKKSAPKQEQLQLEAPSRGRFEKSAPTLYEGEDLDVPTFIRRGIRL
jgi:cell division protein FtsZ